MSSEVIARQTAIFTGFMIFAFSVVAFILVLGIVYAFIIEPKKLAKKEAEEKTEVKKLEHGVAIVRDNYAIEIQDYDKKASTPWNLLLNDFYNALKGLGYGFDSETREKFEDLIGDPF